MRGFVAGLVWGGIVSAVGLGVVSQLAPPPANRDEAPATETAPMPEAAAIPATPQAPAVAEPEAQAAAEPSAGAPGAEAPDPAPQAPATPPTEGDAATKPEAAPAAPPKSDATAPAVVPAPTALPAKPAATAAAEPAPETVAPAVPEAGAGADAAPAPADLPPAPPAVELAEDGPLPGEVPAHSPLAPVPAEPAAVTEPAAPAEPLLDRPEPGLDGGVDGVTTNRLPRIETEGTAEAGAEQAAVSDPRPLAKFAASFENPEAKPLFSILLIDDGQSQIDRSALAALAVPVTIVLDPGSPGSTYLAELYRRAGKEVAMLASQIPEGATPSDLQVTFTAHAAALEQSVAVVDLPEGGFQNNRQIAADLVPVIKDQGRGLVTFDKGLNAGDQVARREAVPAALVFREIDGQGEDAAAMRRHLDRAAFKAAQDGRVAVLGHARADTIAALLEWSIEGRAGSVALAPLTAVLATPE